ncbi:MAG TPA: ATP-binding protein [Magnetospirillaceae bacterium]|nr:ATP-binding protein [Magnetospirillaceae bacterium]
MRRLIFRKLIVDDHNELFDAQGMRYMEFPSDHSRIREFAGAVLADCPEEFREGNLLEQQVSEIIKNAVRHGNRCEPARKVRVWYDLRRRVRLIVEDEGEGFAELDAWNAFLARRQAALYREDFDEFLRLASWRGRASGPDDGGNSLIAALEYWNGGIVYNELRNKLGAVRWFTNGSGRAG